MTFLTVFLCLKFVIFMFVPFMAFISSFISFMFGALHSHSEMIPVNNRRKALGKGSVEV